MELFAVGLKRVNQYFHLSHVVEDLDCCAAYCHLRESTCWRGSHIGTARGGSGDAGAGCSGEGWWCSPGLFKCYSCHSLDFALCDPSPTVPVNKD